MADRLYELTEAKALMWDSMVTADPDKRASLMGQWRALESQIAELEREAGKVADPVDEIAARRSARGGATARARDTAGGAG